MLSPSTLSKTIPKWLNLKSFISSVSCTNAIQINPEINQNTPNITDFDAKIQSLRNKLCPDYLIKVLKSTSDINSAVKLFKWASLQRRFNHTADTYYWIIFKLGMAENVEEMEGFCQNMVKDRCPGVEDVLLSLVDAFARNCRLNEAMRVLFNMNLAGIKPSIDVFNFVLGALVEEKRGFQDVVFVYKEMVKAGVAPSIDTLNYLLEVLFETDRVDSALDQYRRINKKGCIPNSRTFEIVIKGLIAKNRVDDSVTILHEMLELGCLPELRFFRSAILLFCGEDRLEQGIRLFRKMKDSNFTPDPFIYGALIQCLCKHLRLDEAVNLLEEMMESRLTPDNNVFVDIVNGFCKLGKINEAIKLLEDKHVHVTSPHNALLKCCCDADKFFTAKGLLEKMSERNIDDCDSWNILIRWLCEKVGVMNAYELLGRMIISSLIPDCATYSALVAGNCRLSKYEDALQLFLQLHAKFWILDPASYSELIEGLCRGEKYLEAVKVFCYMSENRCSLQSLSFNMLIEGVCNMGVLNEAVRLQLLAYNSGTSCSNATCNYIMLGLSKSDKGKHMLAFLSQMLVQGTNLDVEAYCILIQSMIAQKQIKDCTLFLNVMVNEGLVPDSDTLYKLLSCLANHSRLYLISVSLDKLVSDCEVLDSAMYNILINGLWKEGNKNEAHRLLDLMLEKGWVPDSMTHGLLIGSGNREGKGEGKLTYVDSIKDSVSDILVEGLRET
ncbi:pentatricopeptide repeat-containing protein [Populus alba x Populus x berolinensis]|uniref:Pentatricopeptide repeat-containing protein n=1 Tax=Populus alba x Populus x berolinensis TaxID=444605 RepID=A0AAD6PZY6_9ROSI|nr:pentatricopeptide repeat-containing protein [Populus alba x Populus x berolinensis]KAJ6974079.1 pentatricopeptide repeat-containing protein [Populus alba x Populus x berolinensis]